jgi:hypothetical protein
MASIISSVVMSLIFDSANLRAFCAGVLAGEFDDGDDLSVIFNTSHKIAEKNRPLDAHKQQRQPALNYWELAFSSA